MLARSGVVLRLRIPGPPSAITFNVTGMTPHLTARPTGCQVAWLGRSVLSGLDQIMLFRRSNPNFGRQRRSEAERHRRR
jgi:hypothetical protein